MARGWRSWSLPCACSRRCGSASARTSAASRACRASSNGPPPRRPRCADRSLQPSAPRRAEFVVATFGEWMRRILCCCVAGAALWASGAMAQGGSAAPRRRSPRARPRGAYFRPGTDSTAGWMNRPGARRPLLDFVRIRTKVPTPRDDRSGLLVRRRIALDRRPHAQRRSGCHPPAREPARPALGTPSASSFRSTPIVIGVPPQLQFVGLGRSLRLLPP